MSKIIPQYCSFPWANLVVDVDGGTRPCCKFLCNDNVKAPNLKDFDLQQAFNSREIQEVRGAFLRGERHPGCQTCWDEEDSGVKSMRQERLDQYSEQKIDYSNIYVEYPLSLDLKLSNRCNLKCRICNSGSSSLWLEENIKHSLEMDSYAVQNKDLLLSAKISAHPKNISILNAWAQKVESVEIFGGEPLLNREARELEKILLESGRSHEISLLYNTNGTVFSESLCRDWQRFKRVVLCLSVDDFGSRFSYQRHPANWESVRRNINRYLEYSSEKFIPLIYCSVSLYNIWHLDEFLVWAQRHILNCGIKLNIVHYYPYLSIRNLPVPLKEKVCCKLESSKKEHEPHLREQIQSLIQFMQTQTGQDEKFRVFLAKCRNLDLIRNEKFSEVYPDYYLNIQKWLNNNELFQEQKLLDQHQSHKLID